ncbi:hypothetical protein XELAEV_18032563mg, partial [Xenopus laevis]
MYAVYRQAHPPTGLEFSMSCNFFNNSERNLVVAGTSQLYVYRLNPSSESSSKGESVSEVKGHKEKLELMASFSFFGNIMSMASVQLAGAKRDALLLSFKEAKLSVVEYDPGTHDLKTLSLHYFEEPELRDGFVQNVHIPKVRVDPSGRCAVMLIYGTQLVVLPFRRDTLAEEHEGLHPPVAVGVVYSIYSSISQVFQHPKCAEKVYLSLYSSGVVIFAVNSLLYLNQSVPPYGVSLNSLTNGTTSFPLKPQEEVRITLDCSQATFISYDKMVISLKGGEIYVVTLITDGMRSVRSFHFDKAAASVLTTSMTPMEPGYLFLGSRLGNSLLLRYTEKAHDSPAGPSKDPDKPDEPPNKKKRVDSSLALPGSKGNTVDEVDEIEVYGSEMQSGTQLSTYSFEVCDSILNIGPCAMASMGEPAFLSEEESPEPDLEIVLCSGYGKNGALSVLQKSIRPQVVTTFELPGCHDMWTVISSQKKEEEGEKEGETPSVEAEEDTNRHGFLILSRDDSTM